MTLALALPAAKASAEQIWRISTFDYRPLAYIDQDGNYTGLIGETIKAICSAADILCSHHLMPYKRAEEEILTGNIDATVTINTGAPKACCEPGKWAATWAAGFYNMDPSRPAPTTAEELKGRSLIVVHGMESPYSFAPDLDKWAKEGLVEVHKATSIETAARMLLRRRADLLWGANDFSWFFKKLNNGKVPHFDTHFTFPIVFWVSKNHPELMEKLDKGYQRLKEQGLLDSDNLAPSRIQ